MFAIVFNSEPMIGSFRSMVGAAVATQWRRLTRISPVNCPFEATSALISISASPRYWISFTCAAIKRVHHSLLQPTAAEVPKSLAALNASQGSFFLNSLFKTLQEGLPLAVREVIATKRQTLILKAPG